MWKIVFFVREMIIHVQGTGGLGGVLKIFSGVGGS